MSKGYYKPDGSLFVLAGANKMEGGGLITVLSCVHFPSQWLFSLHGRKLRRLHNGTRLAKPQVTIDFSIMLCASKIAEAVGKLSYADLLH